MEGVLRYAPILLEASPVPAALATLLVLMPDLVWVCEHHLGFQKMPNQNGGRAGIFIMFG